MGINCLKVFYNCKMHFPIELYWGVCRLKINSYTRLLNNLDTLVYIEVIFLIFLKLNFSLTCNALFFLMLNLVLLSLFSFISIVLWLIIAQIVYFVFPQQLNVISSFLRQNYFPFSEKCAIWLYTTSLFLNAILFAYTNI